MSLFLLAAVAWLESTRIGSVRQRSPIPALRPAWGRDFVPQVARISLPSGTVVLGPLVRRSVSCGTITVTPPGSRTPPRNPPSIAACGASPPTYLHRKNTRASSAKLTGSHRSSHRKARRCRSRSACSGNGDRARRSSCGRFRTSRDASGMRGADLRESTMCVARRTATLRRVRVTDSGKARSGSIKAVKGWVFHSSDEEGSGEVVNARSAKSCRLFSLSRA